MITKPLEGSHRTEIAFTLAKTDSFDPVLVVGAWEISSIVDATGFLTNPRGLDDDRSHRQHILQFPTIAAVELLREDISSPAGNIFRCFSEGLFGSSNPCTPPHQTLQRIADISNVQSGVVPRLGLIDQRQCRKVVRLLQCCI